MIPMSQYSLTQLESMAKAQDNDIALELISRIDDSQQQRFNEVPNFFELESRAEERYEEGYSDGRSDGESEGKVEGEAKVIEAVKYYLESLDFTEENINTFISKVKERI